MRAGQEENQEPTAVDSDLNTESSIHFYRIPPLVFPTVYPLEYPNVLVGLVTLDVADSNRVTKEERSSSGGGGGGWRR